MKLFFHNGFGKEILIAEPKNKEEVIEGINRFLNDHKFKSYYTRIWEECGRLKFDVGSHTEFFYLDGMDYKTWQER